VPYRLSLLEKLKTTVTATRDIEFNWYLSATKDTGELNEIELAVRLKKQ
jgi:hypothetical protein